MEIQSIAGRLTITGLPDKCPFCHNSITPNVLYGHRHGNKAEVFLFCPDTKCNMAFIAYYYYEPGSTMAKYTNRISQGTPFSRIFSEKINEISPSFVTIYSQSNIADQQELNEICGVGYRKALEFLIKDYTKTKYPDDLEKIEKLLLAKVIEKYVDDVRIKTVAKRAVWIGNDETHYIRKWEGKNLVDLKKLIDLTIHWIEMETLTSSFETDMPEK